MTSCWGNELKENSRILLVSSSSVLLGWSGAPHTNHARTGNHGFPKFFLSSFSQQEFVSSYEIELRPTPPQVLEPFCIFCACFICRLFQSVSLSMHNYFIMVGASRNCYEYAQELTSLRILCKYSQMIIALLHCLLIFD